MIVNNKATFLTRVFSQENSRSQKLKKNIVGSLLVKGGSIAIGLVLIPMTIHYVSPPQYGIWLTLSSIVGWFSFFDVGFGHGLRNNFATAVAQGEFELAKIYVSTTYAILALIVTGLFAVFLLANQFLHWPSILNAPDNMASDLRLISYVVLGFFCLQMVLQLMGTVVIANQQPAIASFVTFSANVISLVVIFVLTRLTEGNLVYLGITLSLSPVLAFTAASIWLYTGKYRRFAPSLKYVRFQYARKLMSLGLKFFILQIGAIILFQTNNFIISQLFGPEQVTSYNIAFKYFGAVQMLFSIIVSPFWSASTEAWIKQDFDWIKGILKKLRTIALMLVGLLAAMLIVSDKVYGIWIGPQVKVPFSLSVAVAVFSALQIGSSIFLQFINGISKVTLQLYIVIFTSFANIPLAMYLGRQFGLWGVVSSSILLFGTLGIFMYIQTGKLINHKARGIWNR